MFEQIFRILGGIHKQHEIASFQTELTYGDVDIDAQILLGRIALIALSVSLFLSLLFYMFLYPTLKDATTSVSAVIFFVILIVTYFGLKFYFSRKADHKAEYIDRVLASWLNLLANKLESGDSIERALLLSARPEFGVLRKEVLKVVNEINLGTTVKDALNGMKMRIHSRNVEEVIKLVVYAMDSGGEFAHLLKKMAIRINDRFINEQQMRAELSSQLSIISIILLVAAPAMFGLANVLVKVVVTIAGTIDLGNSSFAMPITISASQDTVTNILWVSLISLGILVVMGCLMLGAIKEGEAKAGVKNIPTYLIVALIVFFISRYLLSKIMGGIVGF